MVINIGRKQYNIFLNGKAYALVIPSSITNGIKLLSSDNYILTDINGIYLTTKEEE